MKRERQTISLMISLYCKSEHKHKELCEDCLKLKDYAFYRLEKCPFQEKKPACQNCKIRCYKADMKKQVKEVMRKSGPKVLIHNPYYAVMHVIDSFRKAPELPRKRKSKTESTSV